MMGLINGVRNIIGRLGQRLENYKRAKLELRQESFDPAVRAQAALRCRGLSAKDLGKAILRDCIDIEFRIIPEPLEVYKNFLEENGLSDRAISLIDEEMNDIATFKQDLRFFEAAKQLKKELGIDVSKLTSYKPRLKPPI